ncbi:MAG: OmpA family protein [Bacteroidota bacterium]
MKYLISIWSICLLPLLGQSQVAYWQKYLGGSGYDAGKELFLKSDGTLIAAGSIQSTDFAGKDNHGKSGDILAIKLATQGKVFWTATLGGSEEEKLNEMIETRDGGYMLVGTTASDDGDVNGNHGGTDAWLVKMDDAGKVLWSRCYGGSGDDQGKSIIETSDGGLLIAGEAGSNNGNMQSQAFGGLDAWVAKLNAQGDIIWEYHFGGSGNDKAERVHEILPNTYTIIGSTDSRDISNAPSLGKKDAWVWTVDQNGELLWQKRYGGESHDDVHDSFVDDAGQIILAGTTFSTSKDITENKGQGDCWLLKLTAKGQVIWSKNYGGERPDGFNGISPTSDGGYLLCGMTKSRGGDITVNLGYFDGWLVKTNAEGEILWTRTMGFEAKDALNKAVEAPNGGFLTIGTVQLAENGMSLPGHNGSSDMWLANISDPKRSGVKPYVTPPVLFGKIIDKDTQRPLSASITLTNNATLDSITSTQSERSDGSFIMLLPAYGLVSINVLTPGYLFYGQDIQMDTVISETSTALTIGLEAVRIGSSLILRNIYFETGKWDILKPSFAELERMVAFLELNPRVQIEVSGHTDNTGNKDEKVQLSLNRANAIRDYLVKRGINKGRMKVKGFGMYRPIASNATADGRRKNRRVEFKVINK